MSPHVLVLAGGLSVEREVSLRSGARVASALRSAGAQVDTLDVDGRLLEVLEDGAPDAVVIALHGAAGEDGSLRTVLELAGVPFVGTAAAACRTAWDKPATKAALAAAGVATPDWVALPHEIFRELGAPALLDRIAARLGLPVVVKPAKGGSALGVRRVDDRAGLPAAVAGALAYGTTCLVEQHVDGVELAVTVLELDGEPRALPVVEVVAEQQYGSYAARTTSGAVRLRSPAEVPGDVLAAAQEAALRAHAVLGLRDLSRTDLVVAADGTPQVLEVDVSPGMTEASLVPAAVAAEGLDLGVVLRDLATAAAARG